MKTKKKQVVKINWDEVAKRGFITAEEYPIVAKMPMNKVGVTGKNPHTSEHFWCVRFPEDKTRIVIFNDLVNYWGSVTAGLVGKLKDGNLDLDQCDVDFPKFGPLMMKNYAADEKKAKKKT